MLKTPLTKIYPLDSVLSNNFFKNLKKAHPNADFFLKEERSNETGTHKDRSFKKWLPLLKNKGITNTVISSSGNSAISAAYFSRELFSLDVFVSPSLSLEKKRRLKNFLHEKVRIHETNTPKKDAFQYARDTDSYFLRSSSDDDSLIGYEAIGEELQFQIGRVGSIFIPTSSGSTAAGIIQAFQKTHSPNIPSLYISQVPNVHPIAEVFDKTNPKKERSLADSITDLVAHRKKEIVSLIKETGGAGFIITNEEIQEIQHELMPAWQNLGYETLLALAALPRVTSELKGNVVCLCTS